MAAQKSIAKGAGTHAAAPEGKAAVRPRHAKSPRSSTTPSARQPTRRPRARQDGDLNPQRGDLLENLSARLALVETASIALRKFEEDPEIGSICASLEHAIRMLAKAHEAVDLHLRESTR